MRNSMLASIFGFILMTYVTESESLCEIVNKELKCASVSAVSSRILNEIPGVSEVTQVTILSNPKLQIFPKSFQSTVKLQRVVMHYNIIDKIFSDTFTNLPKLKYLSLGHNSINRIFPGAFANLTALEKLRVDDNNLEDIPRGLFSDLPVQELALSKNKISSLEDSVLENLPNLKKLRLDNNKLQSIFVHQLVTYPERLEVLWLHNNSITSISNYMLQNLKNLKVLNLGFNFISTIEPNSFAQVPNLYYLVLTNNHLKVIDGGIFPRSGMSYLEKIYLDNNKLMFLSSSFIVRLSSLKKITIVGNPWLCPCLSNVQKLLNENNIKEMCHEDYTNGERPVCVNDKVDDPECRYVYNDELSEKYSIYKQNNPLHKPTISCIL